MQPKMRANEFSEKKDQNQLFCTTSNHIFFLNSTIDFRVLHHIIIGLEIYLIEV